MPTLPTANEVLNFLPENGDPIAFGKLASLMGYHSKEGHKRLRGRLDRMAAEGTAQIIYGSGWRRLPSPHPDPELARLLADKDPGQNTDR